MNQLIKNSGLKEKSLKDALLWEFFDKYFGKEFRPRLNGAI